MLHLRTNLVCRASISFFIFSCSASYAALSGFPPPPKDASWSDVSFGATEETGVAVPDEALDLLALPFEAAEDFDFGAGIIVCIDVYVEKAERLEVWSTYSAPPHKLWNDRENTLIFFGLIFNSNKHNNYI